MARRVLDEADDVNQALQLVASAMPSASSALTLIAVEGRERAAITAEVFPGSRATSCRIATGSSCTPTTSWRRRPRSATASASWGPTLLRLGLLQRQVRGTSDAAAVRRAMSSRIGGGGGTCCRPDPGAAFGARWSTLATIQLDVPEAGLVIRRGGPDEPVAHTTLDAALPVHA